MKGNWSETHWLNVEMMDNSHNQLVQNNLRRMPGVTHIPTSIMITIDLVIIN